MSNKILFCATVDYHFKAFHLPVMKWFKEQGWEVHVAASGNMNLPFTDVKYEIPIQRAPFNKGNVKAFQKLKAIIDNDNYSIIHCHTPLGGALTRLAAKETRKSGTKVIYTAHGFHFCKGASALSWLIYYPIEKHLAKFTDCLITINSEDYSIAMERRFQACQIDIVNGVGVNTDHFKPVTEKQRKELRLKMGLRQDEFLLFYAAEFNKNKNQKILIKALANLKDELPKARLLLAGEGSTQEGCRLLARQLGLEDRIDFLGFRKDINQILPACDLAVASSYREGLPVNIMEAMACGLPVIASDNRGHRELVFNDYNGYLIKEMDSAQFAGAIKKLYINIEQKKLFGTNGRTLIAKKFNEDKIILQLITIYKNFMEEKVRMIWEAQ
ncbi:glycosyltransferase family 4 protein [Sutcliffiella rhizosphaerae]|nr:glycosyltransferase family 4 protein [Sutcliffiella rhizosphaerae]